MDEWIIEDQELRREPTTMGQRVLELDYHPSLPKDLALAPGNHDEILAFYNLSDGDYERLSNSINFRKDLARWRNEVAKDGFTLALAARAAAEAHLGDMVAMMQNPSTPTAVSVRIYELLLGIGGVATKPAVEQVNPTAQAVQININLA